MSLGLGVSDVWPAQPILYSIALGAALIPAYPSIKSRNVGVILLDLWLIAVTTVLLIGCIVWRNNPYGNPAPVYCDIATSIIIMSGPGFQSSFLVITRQLYKLSKANVVLRGKADKRKELTINLLIGIGIPALSKVGHAIVQGHRYNIVEDIGCWPAVANVWISIPLCLAWPLAITIISSIYGPLALRNFFKRRRQFENHLAASHSDVKKNLYLRLMIISSFDAIIALPFYTWGLVWNFQAGLTRWISWESLQRHWSRIHYFNRLFLDHIHDYRQYHILYMVASFNLSILFFLLFGLSREAKSCYRTAYYACLKALGVKITQPESPQEGVQTAKRTWIDILLRRQPKPPKEDQHGTNSTAIFLSMGDSSPTHGTFSTDTRFSETRDERDIERGAIITEKKSAVKEVDSRASFKLRNVD